MSDQPTTAAPTATETSIAAIVGVDPSRVKVRRVPGDPYASFPVDRLVVTLLPEPGTAGDVEAIGSCLATFGETPLIREIRERYRKVEA